MLGESGDDAVDVVAGVNHDCLAGGLIPEDGAVALEWANYEDFVDHFMFPPGTATDVGLSFASRLSSNLVMARKEP
jgi:hypothetical protein